MRSTIKKLGKLTAGYSLVSLVGPLITVLLTPFYTRVLTPADYGVVDVAMTTAGLIGIAAMMGMDSALNGYFFEGDEQHRRNLVSTAFIFALASGSLMAVLLALFAPSLATWLFNDPARQITLYCLALYIAFGPAYAVLTAALKLRMGVRRINALGLTYVCVLVGCTLLFVLGMQLKATGIVAANAVAIAVSCVVGMVLSYRPFHGAFQASLLRGLLKTGFNLMLSVAGLMVLANIDRLLLTQYVSKHQLGLYSIANKVCSMGSIVIMTALGAWVPMAIEMTHQPQASQQLARITEFFLVAAIFLGLGIGLFAPEILSIFTRELYAPAAPYITVLMAYHAPIIACASLFSIGLHARKQTRWIALAYALAAPINVALNLLLNPFWGVWGAVWATLIAGVVLALATLAFCQRVMFVNYRWLRILTLLGIYASLISLYLLFPNLHTWGYKLGSLFVFGLSIFATNIVSVTHLKVAWQSALHRSKLFQSFVM